MSFPFLKVAAAALRAAVLTASVLVLTSCGGGGSVPSNRDSLRPLSDEFTSRKAVAYGPYRTAKNDSDRVNETITEDMIKQDMGLIQAAGFGLIRLFDSSDKVAKLTLKVIRDNKFNVKVMLGAYVQGTKYASAAEVPKVTAYNNAELLRVVTLANQYSDIVLAVSVGNETMVTWSFNPIDPRDVASYLGRVRSQISQPVTSDDNWAYYANSDRVLLDAMDFVSVHTYPELDTQYLPEVWDWRQSSVPAASRAAAMMDAAISSARREYSAVRSFLDSKNLSAMPIVVGETGWNAVDVGALKYRAHPVNQKMYFDRLAAWAAESKAGNGPKSVIYFQAFDEPWKQSDDKWGLFNVNRQARYAIQALNGVSATWVYEAGSYKDSDAIYFTPPVVGAAVVQNKYTLYSETAIQASELQALWPTQQRFDAFDGDSASYQEVASSAAPGDGSKSIEITPKPKSYGWGLLLQSAAAGSPVNLSNFSATGSLNFSIKTAYRGKIEVGISTDTESSGPQEAYLQIGNGQYGYCNSNNWCNVSIPVQAFLAVNSKADLRLVLSRLIIADRFGFTGNSQSAGLPVLNIDGIYWSR